MVKVPQGSSNNKVIEFCVQAGEKKVTNDFNLKGK